MFSFPKSARLLKSHEYRRVSLHGTLVTGKYMLLQYLPLERGIATPSKLGISVPKQYGKAHIRNKFKRYMREIFRKETHHIPLAIHIKPRFLAKEASFQELAAEYHTLVVLNKIKHT
jgi:ribonuclease P protein component